MNYDPRISKIDLTLEFRVSDGPIIQELANRLATAIDENADEIEQLEAHVDELEGATCDEFEKHDAEIEKLEDDYEDSIAQVKELKERLSAANKRETEYVAELEQLKYGDNTMLEQQNEILAEQIRKEETNVGEVKAEQIRTNELLSKILSAIRGEEDPAPEPVQAAKKARKAVMADNDTAKEPVVEEVEEENQKVSFDDVREALIEVKDRMDRETALEIIERHAGSHEVGDIPEDKYADVLNDCQSIEVRKAS